MPLLSADYLWNMRILSTFSSVALLSGNVGEGLSQGHVVLHLHQQVAGHLFQYQSVPTAVLYRVHHLFLPPAAPLPPSEVHVQILYPTLVGQQLGVARHSVLRSRRHRGLGLQVFSQSVYQVLHVPNFALAGNRLRTQLHFEVGLRLGPFWLVGKLVVQDCLFQVEVVIMGPHCLNLSLVLLNYHLPKNTILGLQGAHFCPLSKESTVFGLVEGEVGPTHLKVAPVLEVHQSQGPSSG